jgi:hypothetical protein
MKSVTQISCALASFYLAKAIVDKGLFIPPAKAGGY